MAASTFSGVTYVPAAIDALTAAIFSARTSGSSATLPTSLPTSEISTLSSCPDVSCCASVRSGFCSPAGRTGPKFSGPVMPLIPSILLNLAYFQAGPAAGGLAHSASRPLELSTWRGDGLEGKPTGFYPRNATYCGHWCCRLAAWRVGGLGRGAARPDNPSQINIVIYVAHLNAIYWSSVSAGKGLTQHIGVRFSVFAGIWVWLGWVGGVAANVYDGVGWVYSEGAAGDMATGWDGGWGRRVEPVM